MLEAGPGEAAAGGRKMSFLDLKLFALLQWGTAELQ